MEHLESPTEDGSPISPLLTPEQVAGILNVKPQTLANWRATGRVKGLDFVEVGGQVRYTTAAVTRFIAANTKAPS